MYTNSCCSVSCVSSVDLLSSLSQLNSSIEIFSWLPVFRVGLTCSSSCLIFASFQWVSLLYSLIPCEALSSESHCFPTHHHSFNLFIFGRRLALFGPISIFHSIDCIGFHFVLTFLLCTFFSLVSFTIFSLTCTAQVNNLHSIHFIINFTVFCTVHGCIFLFVDSFLPHFLEVGQD